MRSKVNNDSFNFFFAADLERLNESLINVGPLKDSKFTPITVEKEPLQRTANERADLNNNSNNLNTKPNSNLKTKLNIEPNKNLSEEFKDLEKYEKIRELIIKNENLRAFIEKIGKLNHTMSSFHKLNEINKLITELSQNQLELKNESVLLQKQVDELNALNTRQDQLIETRNEQDGLLQRAETVNQKLRSLVSDHREQNLELKQNYERFINSLTESLAENLARV